jgi:hypothetical protein
LKETAIMAKLAATTKKKTKPLSKAETLNAVCDAVGDAVSRKHRSSRPSWKSVTRS